MRRIVITRSIDHLLPLALLLSWVMWQIHETVSTPLLSSDTPKLTCLTPPTFRIGYEQEKEGVRPKERGFEFFGLGWIEADVCTPSVLTIKADGQAADGQAPILRILLDSQLVTEATFKNEQTVKIHIPKSGRIRAIYVNDYYASEARVAYLEQLRFFGFQCQQLKVNVPSSTGGQWFPETNAATLVFNVPMSLIPCSAGKLSLQVSGRAGNNRYPVLDVKQGNIRLGKIEVGAKVKKVEFNTSVSPITIRLINPYFKELGDRNLTIRSLQLTAN